MSLHTLHHIQSFNVIVSYLGFGQPPLLLRLITFNKPVYLCIYIRDWRGAGFTRGPAVPRGPRGGAGRSLAYLCGALRVRAYDIDCGAGAGPRAVSYCGPLRACIAYMRSNVSYCFPFCNREDVSLHQRVP